MGYARSALSLGGLLGAFLPIRGLLLRSPGTFSLPNGALRERLFSFRRFVALAATIGGMADVADELLIRKVMGRLIPFCVICYLLNYIDRVNISVAQLKMVDPVSGVPGFTEGVFATGAGIFFLGYFLFELPSNLIQQRVGPRRWIARIMITWGLVTIAFMFTAGPRSFYGLRFLLGVAEAGFFPGMILYLSHWVPHAYRARASALFLTSTAISGVIGNPLTGGILSLAEKYPTALKSWQWVFLLEGLPSVVMGIVTLYFLTDEPEEARWLEPGERLRLTQIMAEERAEHPAHGASDLRDAFASRHTWILSLLYSLVVFGFYTVNFFTPKIIQGALLAAGTITKETPPHLTFLYVGVISAIPFGAAAVGMVMIARHSDRTNERKYHVAFACALIAIGLVLAGVAPWIATGNVATVLTLVGLSVGAIGGFGIFGPFWALPPQLLAGTAAAAAFAIINSVGNLLGGFLGPKFLDKMGQQNGLLMAGGLAAVAGVVAVCAPIAGRGNKLATDEPGAAKPQRN